MEWWMDLSFDEFVEILASFRTRDRSKDAGDKRRARRIGHRAQVFITPCNSNTSSDDKRLAALAIQTRVSVLLRDFSPRGVSLLCEEALERGQSFVLHLKQTAGKSVEMLCTVVHCRAGGKGQYLVGAEFSCVVDSEEAPRDAAPRELDLDRIRHSILD
jgi:hypothetical protein